MLPRITRWLGRVGGALLALLILFEEWGWDPLQRALGQLGRLPLLRQAEALISRLPPHAALVAFVLPALMLLPIKLLALALIGRGQPLLGLVVVVLAKLLGTAVVARLFTLTRPALMQLPWFVQAYGHWTAWKDSVLARVRASWAWRAGRVLRRQFQRQWARWRRT